MKKIILLAGVLMLSACGTAIPTLSTTALHVNKAKELCEQHNTEFVVIDNATVRIDDNTIYLWMDVYCADGAQYKNQRWEVARNP